VSLISRRSSHGIEGVAWVQVGTTYLQTLLLVAAAAHKGLLGA
jgi:hypothetical protein